MNIEAVIFDMDGTLIDSLEDLADSVNLFLQQEGYPVHPFESYRYFVGKGAKSLVIDALPESDRGETLIHKALKAFEEIYGKNWKKKTKLYPGIAEMLDKLVENETPISILSNKPENFVIECASWFLSKWHFSPILGQKDGKPAKPSPDRALEIAESLKTKPGNILFVGDSNIDMQTANNAGMISAGVSWGFRPVKELIENGAKCILEKPGDILKIISG